MEVKGQHTFLLFAHSNWVLLGCALELILLTERMVRGIFQTEEISVGKYLSKISEEERAVDSIANLINAKCR